MTFNQQTQSNYGPPLPEPVIKPKRILKEPFLPVVPVTIKVKCTCTLRHLMVQNNNLPCNVKFMIEGEEEVGSVT
jgi:hypothetical protein